MAPRCAQEPQVLALERGGLCRRLASNGKVHRLGSKRSQPLGQDLRSEDSDSDRCAGRDALGYNRRCFGWRSPAALAAEGEAGAGGGEDEVAEEKELIAVSVRQAVEGPFLPSQEACAVRRASLAEPPAFGYPGSLDQKAPYARFDIRDEVCLRVGGLRHGQQAFDRGHGELVVVGVKLTPGAPRLWFQPKNLRRPGAFAFPSDLRNVAARPGTRRLAEVRLEDFSTAEDSDGEEMRLCYRCHLPLGESVYAKKDGEETVLHGECMAQLMLQDFREEEASSQRADAELKQARRQEFDIGWRADRVPRGSGRPGGGGGGAALRCLVLEAAPSRLVRVRPTAEPACAVNLEYLSIALRVRGTEAREPLFSLDPVDPAGRGADPKAWLQEKRFEPAWLAGTSVGEALFQADFHLKELSMGEREQPVVGMKSCLDLAQEERDQEWHGREWYIVKKAEVQLSADNALVPRVKMGVEAREQVITESGELEDAAITREDHPLVQYADEFTRNFDLVAERRGAVYHLRELAKATVLAKYLEEAQLSLEDSWFDPTTEAELPCCMTLPQLWNERSRWRIHLRDGRIVNHADGRVARTEEELGGCRRGLYGGVQFGLDKFELRRRAAPELVPRVIASMAQAAGMPSRDAQGVDLNLDNFHVAPAEQLERLPEAVVAAEEGCGRQRHEVVLDDEEAELLREVFNPELSDRCEEGEHFLPPETSPGYLQTLRELVTEERKVRQRRKDCFLSKDFALGELDPCFSASWQCDIDIALEHRPSGAAGQGLLHERPDYKAEASLLEPLLQLSPPCFNRSAEDGMRFRIYRLGSLEVRTTEEPLRGGLESIGAVFSAAPPPRPARPSEDKEEDEEEEASALREAELVTKVTEYVAAEGGDARFKRSFVVLLTESQGEVMTEKLGDGSVTWEVNPPALELLTSTAKVMRSADCSKKPLTVKDMQRFHAKESGAVGFGASASARKRYARAAFERAKGGAEPPQRAAAEGASALRQKPELDAVAASAPTCDGCGGPAPEGKALCGACQLETERTAMMASLRAAQEKAAREARSEAEHRARKAQEEAELRSKAEAERLAGKQAEAERKRQELRSLEEPVCRSGHVLEPFSPMAGFPCDVCDRDAVAGDVFWGCRAKDARGGRACDFDVCGSCKEARLRRVLREQGEPA